MTVDEMIDWLESAKLQSEESGQDIGNYPVNLVDETFSHGGTQHFKSSDVDLKVDHGLSVVQISKEA